MPIFGTALVGSQPPAQLLARGGDTIQLLNTDPINTIYLGNNPGIQSTDANVAPLGPGASIVFQQTDFDIYGITAAGTTALVAIYPGAASFSQPLKTIVAGTYLLYDGTPAFGNLFLSIASVATTDSFGNVIQQGFNLTGFADITNIFSVTNNGSVVASIDGSGNVNANILNAATDIEIGGQSIFTQIDALPLGLVAWANNGITAGTQWPSTAIGTTSVALMELDQVLTAGRAYEVIVSPVDVSMSAIGQFFYINLYYTTDGSTPSTASSNLTNFLLSSGSVAGGFGVAAAHHAGATVVIIPAATANYRILLSSNTTSGTGKFITPLQLTINDVGAATPANSASQGTVLGSGSSGGSTPQNYTKNFYPDHIYSYYGADASFNANTIRDVDGVSYHGGESASGGGANGTQYHFMEYIGDPQSIQTSLSGATINWVQLYWYCSHAWYNSGMYLTVGRNSNGHIGNPNSGRTDVLVNGTSNDYFHCGVGGWSYANLPASVGAAFASGAAKSIQLGPGTPNLSLNNYGFSSTYQPYLRVNYSK